MTLSQAIKKHPKGMIYYHDNQEWVYYKRKLTEAEIHGEEDVDESLIVCEGNNWSDNYGYAPDIVLELAKLLGIEVESA